MPVGVDVEFEVDIFDAEWNPTIFNGTATVAGNGPMTPVDPVNVSGTLFFFVTRFNEPGGYDIAVGTSFGQLDLTVSVASEKLSAGRCPLDA